MFLNAKLAYLLSTCHKFTDAFFVAMVRQFASSKLVATRHYFTIFINMCEPDDGEYAGKFAVKNVYCKFANADDAIMMEALQYHNNMILSWEMPQIYNALIRQNIKLDAHQIVAMYTLASLVKMYKGANGAGFKYIFVPVVINYGRNPNLLHQTGLIIDYENNRFMYYEPYGMYQKYDKSYKECICDLFRAFSNLDFFEGPLQSKTYHEFFGLSEGIQQIILRKNNARKEQFNAEYGELLQQIKSEFPDADVEPAHTIAEYDKKDHTFKILDLLFNMDRSQLDKTNADKVDEYEKLLNKTLEIYCCYNSKTCVSITLVEMDYFFKTQFAGQAGALQTGDLVDQKIKSMYEEFDVDRPNPVLMTKLNKLIDTFKDSRDIIQTVENNVHIFDICKRLFS